MAPVDRGGQGLLAGHDGAGTAGEQPEPVVELGGDALGGQLPAAGRGQLDRERDAVEAMADLGDGGRVGVAHRRTTAGPGGPVRRTGRRRRTATAPGRRRGLRARAAHRRDPPGDLARARRAVRGWWPAPTSTDSPQEIRDQLRARGDQVLAVVEDEQRRLVAELDRQLIDDGRRQDLTSAERGQRGATDRARIGQRVPARPTTRRRDTGRVPRPRRRGRGGSCRRPPNRSASPAARRQQAAHARRSRRPGR